MVMAKDRELRGVGMQNFKYSPDLNNLMHLLHMTSPRCYRNLNQHFKLRTARSIKYVHAVSTRSNSTLTMAFQLDTKYRLKPAFQLALTMIRLTILPPNIARIMVILAPHLFVSR